MFQHKIISNLKSELAFNNHKANEKLLNELKTITKKITQRPNNQHQPKLNKNTKLPVRQRIDLLLDDESPFLELSTLAAYQQYHDQFPSAGIVTGIGVIHKRQVMIVANDSSVKGGTYIKETIKKHLRAQEIAFENKLPCIYLVDSGGIFLPEQSEVFPDKNDFGRIFYNQARLSAMNIPQIAIVMGSCTAGGAYIPAMSDETIIVKNQGTIFLAGPPLVKAATGEIVSAEELGGAEVHTKISGVADHLADNDIHAIHICRNLIETLPENNTVKKVDSPPIISQENILKLIPNQENPFPDVRDIIATITDHSEFHEFKKEYGSTLVCGFAKIKDIKTGIIANNGILFSESALKGAHFIQLCNQRNIPMLFLQNISGFMVGKEYEHKGIAKDGAKMVNALANSKVPFMTIIIGGSYGAGNYAMAGRAYNPRFLFMYPNARISVMGAKQAAEVLVTIKINQAKAKRQTLNKEEMDHIKANIQKKYETEGSPYYSTSRLWDDGIIDPQDTREIVGICLEIMSNKNTGNDGYGVFRM